GRQDSVEGTRQGSRQDSREAGGSQEAGAKEGCDKEVFREEGTRQEGACKEGFGQEGHIQEVRGEEVVREEVVGQEGAGQEIRGQEVVGRKERQEGRIQVEAQRSPLAHWRARRSRCCVRTPGTPPGTPVVSRRTSQRSSTPRAFDPPTPRRAPRRAPGLCVSTWPAGCSSIPKDQARRRRTAIAISCSSWRSRFASARVRPSSPSSTRCRASRVTRSSGASRARWRRRSVPPYRPWPATRMTSRALRGAGWPWPTGWSCTCGPTPRPRATKPWWPCAKRSARRWAARTSASASARR